MNEVFLKSASAIVKLNVDIEIFKQIMEDEFFYAYIPSVKVIDYYEKYDATIYIQKNNVNSIEVNYPDTYYKYNSLNTKDIITLIEFIFERARQEKGIFCIHGASSIVNDKAVICWGPATGMGKTTLALALSNVDNHFYSDEKILIDMPKKKVVGRIKKIYISNDFWKEKFGNVRFYENDTSAFDKEYDISMFVYPLICDNKRIVLEKWNSNKFAWHLYEETSRKIRGTSRVFFNYSYPLASLDTFALSVTRLNMVKEFTDSTPSLYYKGNVDNIVEFVKNNNK